MNEAIKDVERAGMTEYIEPLKALREGLLPPEAPDA